MKMPISPAHICSKGFSLIEVVVALAILALAFHTLLQTALAVASSSQYSRGRELIFLQARTAAADHFSGISKKKVSDVPERYDATSVEAADADRDSDREWTQYAFSDRLRGVPILSFSLQNIETP